MGALSRIWLIAAAGLSLVVPACRRVAPKLEPVQEMAYRVKPAVVRVSAYATARFDVDRDAIEATDRALRRAGLSSTGFTDDQRDSVDTGAGGSGSGFVVHPDGWVLTSDHVIAAVRDDASLRRELRRNGAITVLMKHVSREVLRALSRAGRLDPILRTFGDSGQLLDVIVVRRIELSNGEVIPFTISRSSPDLRDGGSDLALLKVDRRGLPTLQLADSDRVLLQEAIWVIGYPSVASTSDAVIGGWLSQESDLEATFNPGSITSQKAVSSGTQLFQTDAPVYAGNSGGPAVDRSGAVIGIAAWGHTAADQIRFLVPGNLARPLIADAGVALGAESRFDTVYRQGLEKAARGDWSGARDDLAHANELFPRSPDVQRFLRDADLALEELPWWEEHDVELVLTGLFAAMAAALVTMKLSRRATRRAAVPIHVPAHFPAPERSRRMRIDTPPGPAEIPELLGRFTFLNGEREGQQLGLGGSGIRIGREASICEIVLENPKVSRLHAEIVWAEGRTFLIDRGSSNGTWVNGRRIDRAALHDGDIIHFGGRNAASVAYHSQRGGGRGGR